MMTLTLRWLVLGCLALAWPAVMAADAHPGFIGSEACIGCHQQQGEDWLGSHHDLAMQAVTPDTVLGDFNNASFTYGQVTTTFFRKDGGYWVRTDNAEGELEEFPVAWVFGVYPLQQYLLPTGQGRLQALTIAWDARPQSEGGQRWYHLYPTL